MNRDLFIEEMVSTIPFKLTSRPVITKKVWLMWVRAIEQVLDKYDTTIYSVCNILVPLNSECYMRIFHTGQTVEEITFYKKSRCYTFAATHDHQVVHTYEHDVIHINGLYPTYLNLVQKPFLHTKVV